MVISKVLQRKGREVITVQTSDIVAAVVRKLAAEGIGAVVVLDRWQKLSGILTERDLVRVLADEGSEALGREVRELMTAPVITCTPAERIDDVMAMMSRKRIRHLPVIEEGRLAGIVSLGDLVQFRLDEKRLEASVLLDMARLRA
jgi:signal-transduction protein with cAMP-binding, CBS, and nucleotidyltransferase domain